MSARAQALLWIGQRASAAVLALCVLVHLGTIIYAVRGGLSAAEILSRTQGHAGWLAFYTVFVLAVAVHVPIGLRAILAEWLGWRDSSRDLALWVFAAVLATLGMRAVLGVFGAAVGATSG
jgi:fumarate reductase subunit C